MHLNSSALCCIKKAVKLTNETLGMARRFFDPFLTLFRWSRSLGHDPTYHHNPLSVIYPMTKSVATRQAGLHGSDGNVHDQIHAPLFVGFFQVNQACMTCSSSPDPTASES